METTKTQDFIKNYYHININYFHKVILEIINEIDRKKIYIRKSLL
jgi:hypothetical protein